ncbi:hypothetical protein THOG11_20003 [Vibrio harveyi]|nr:hypothetical protein TH15OA1_530392 [Vibrio harveyi]CAH1554221.1 hypothetical protein THOD03_20003 [Vibrio harveyi]CAH1560923.1 hypothetical protein THOG11_20003 [Vibrio harveyi]
MNSKKFHILFEMAHITLLADYSVTYYFFSLKINLQQDYFLQLTTLIVIFTVYNPFCSCLI